MTTIGSNDHQRRRHHRCLLVVGITGPSGSGKSSLAKRLAEEFSANDESNNVILVEEDPQFFRAPVSRSYQHRDPKTENPAHVDWDAYVKRLTAIIHGTLGTTKHTLMLVEHFLLLHDPRVTELMDAIVALDYNENRCHHINNADANDENSPNIVMQVCRDRRIHRNMHRTPEERAHLATYYERHVWPSYVLYCQPRIRRFCAEHPRRSLCLDCREPFQDLEQQAVQAIHAWNKG